MTFQIQKIEIKSPSRNIEAVLLDYGATIQSLLIKKSCDDDPEEETFDVVAGFDDPQDYVQVGHHQNPYFGCVVGRVCNRIEKGKFKLNDKEYQLPINNGPNSLHGGIRGFDKVIWQIKQCCENSVLFSYTAKDGEEGYPGDIRIELKYVLSDKGLTIAYHVQRISENQNNGKILNSVVNLTNHSYFNLSGFAKEPTILDHTLDIPSRTIFQLSPNQIPIKEIEIGCESPFYFGGERIGSRIDQVQEFKGYDHYYVISPSTPSLTSLGENNKDHTLHNKNVLKHHATLRSMTSGIEMKVFSSATGFQLYTGNWLCDDLPFKPHHKFKIVDSDRSSDTTSCPYSQYSSLCIETCEPPNAINNPYYCHSVVLNDENPEWKSKTEYQFSFFF